MPSRSVIRAAETAPADMHGTPFEDLDVRMLIGSAENGAELTSAGQTVYPAGGHGHEAHLHPHAEETLLVLSGTGRCQVGEDVFDVSAGDLVFVPRGAVHATTSATDADLVTVWVLGGAASLEEAGYVSTAAQGKL
jgi:quercetin dioxygenase-like cupin family protein